MNSEDNALIAASARTWVESANNLGMVLDRRMPQEAWSELISHLVRQTGEVGQRSATLVVWLGDLLAYGAERKFRGQIKAYAEAAGIQPATLRLAKLVCSRIPTSARNSRISWSHHCEIARAFSDAGLIREWLSTAEREGWSKAELRKRIRAVKRQVEPPPHAPATGAQVFLLLRELRGLDRIIQTNQRTWQSWPAQTCELALSEVAELVAFIEGLKSRAMETGPKLQAG